MPRDTQCDTGRPNIVLILADDMGYGDLSCLNQDSRIHTPHMDRMAEEGMAFTDAHASTSVCTPSRYGILTGRYAWRGRLQRGVLGPVAPPLIEPDLLTLPQFLRDHGYRTACVGKWHLGMDWPFRSRAFEGDPPWSGAETVDLVNDIDYRRPVRNGPTERGFDSYFGVDVPNFPPYVFIENDRTVGVPSIPKPETVYGTPGPMLEGWDLEAIMPELTRRAVATIDQCARDGRPFFLYFSLTGPHTPIVPTAQFRGQSDAGVYGDWVMQMDDAVGQVNAALERNGLASNTLVIATSDNGSPGRNGSTEAPGSVIETFGHNPSWILRGMKGDTWDGGHRIPLIAKCPDRVPAGSRCDQIVCLMDLMATAAAALGVDMPPNAAQDSLSILPYLTGDAMDTPIRNEIVHHGLSGLYGIRRGDWKLIDGTGSGGFSPSPRVTSFDLPAQLYNMKDDIRERRNRYAEQPEIVHELSVRLAEYRAQAGRGNGGPQRERGWDE